MRASLPPPTDHPCTAEPLFKESSLALKKELPLASCCLIKNFACRAKDVPLGVTRFGKVWTINRVFVFAEIERKHFQGS